MNPRQRRGVLFMVLAVVSGLGVFLAVTSYVRSVESQVGSTVTVFRATSAIDPYTPLGAENLEPVEIPERWTSPSARVALGDLEGRKTGLRLEAGTVVTQDMLLAPSDLSPTEREIAINVDAVTGVGGRVRPGDSVDIYAVFGEVPGLAKQVRVLVRSVRVISLGGTQAVREQSDDRGISENTVIPVTLALEPEDALAVTYANSFADEVRLVGLPTDANLNRSEEKDTYTVQNLGGRAVPEAPQGARR